MTPLARAKLAFRGCLEEVVRPLLTGFGLKVIKRPVIGLNHLLVKQLTPGPRILCVNYKLIGMLQDEEEGAFQIQFLLATTQDEYFGPTCMTEDLGEFLVHEGLRSPISSLGGVLWEYQTHKQMKSLVLRGTRILVKMWRRIEETYSKVPLDNADVIVAWSSERERQRTTILKIQPQLPLHELMDTYGSTDKIPKELLPNRGRDGSPDSISWAKLGL